jgi:hypothetical protein
MLTLMSDKRAMFMRRLSHGLPVAHSVIRGHRKEIAYIYELFMIELHERVHAIRKGDYSHYSLIGERGPETIVPANVASGTNSTIVHFTALEPRFWVDSVTREVKPREWPYRVGG